jgi:hypothetical protein
MPALAQGDKTERKRTSAAIIVYLEIDRNTCRGERPAEMAHYLVKATLRGDLLGELESLLRKDAFLGLQPFGRALSHSLRNARIGEDEVAVWEEEDYCSPPLAQERKAVLDHYFESLSAEPVSAGDGWSRIRALPRLFPGLE